MEKINRFEEIYKQFAIAGAFVSCERYGELNLSVIDSHSLTRKGLHIEERLQCARLSRQCGHVGKWNCIWIDFAVPAESASEAAQKAKTYKRVKRHHKNVIARVVEVAFDEFMLQISKNSLDPYLHCKNIQDQRLIEDINERMQPDIWNIERHFTKRTKKKNNATCMGRK